MVIALVKPCCHHCAKSQNTFVGHEKAQAADGLQVDSARLEYPRCHKCQEVDNEQIFGDGRYVAKHGCYLLFNDLRFYDVGGNAVLSLFPPQNYEKYLFFSAKMASNQLFFTKKVNFSNFLLFF